MKAVEIVFQRPYTYDDNQSNAKNEFSQHRTVINFLSTLRTAAVVDLLVNGASETILSQVDNLIKVLRVPPHAGKLVDKNYADGRVENLRNLVGGLEGKYLNLRN